MVDFSDRVRIRASEETTRLGLAGREGVVFGWTTPSVTSVSVIGTQPDDFAVNVHVDELDEGFWLAEDLLEFLDHQEGTVIGLDGVDIEWVRLADGGWQERPRKKWTDRFKRLFRNDK